MQSTDVIVLHAHMLTQALRIVDIVLGGIAATVIFPVANSWIRRQSYCWLLIGMIYLGLAQAIFTEVGRYQESAKVTWRLPVNTAYCTMTIALAICVIVVERREACQRKEALR